MQDPKPLQSLLNSLMLLCEEMKHAIRFEWSECNENYDHEMEQKLIRVFRRIPLHREKPEDLPFSAS
jgi:hypothetical protein